MERAVRVRCLVRVMPAVADGGVVLEPSAVRRTTSRGCQASPSFVFASRRSVTQQFNDTAATPPALAAPQNR
jgi:hypothetical protein